jgi:hypothetical protein
MPSARRRKTSQTRVVTGTRVEEFPRRRRTPAWDFGRVADGHPYLLRRGKDFDVQVETIRAAARKWAREHDLEVATLVQYAGEGERREKTGLYVQFRPAQGES